MNSVLPYFVIQQPHSHAVYDILCARWVPGGDDDPYLLSWRGIANSAYYMTDTAQYVQLLNFSGCGNTVSGNHPVTQRMIVDSLRMCAPAGALAACCCTVRPAVPAQSVLPRLRRSMPISFAAPRHPAAARMVSLGTFCEKEVVWSVVFS